MSHRRPLHALERWAYDAASLMPGTDTTKTSFIIEICGMQTTKWNSINTGKTLMLQEVIIQAIFAADCLSGRAQIVHIPDELYKDICESKLEDKDRTDIHRSEYLPWPMFAIELNHCDSHLAIVVSSLEYIQSRAKDAQHILGIRTPMLENLTNMFYNPYGKNDAVIATLIPTPRTCKQNAKGLINTLLGDEMVVGETEQLYQNAAISTLEKMDTLPYPLWADGGDDRPANDAILNLITFVIADNVERAKVYEPPKKTQGNRQKRKRKQCEAHIYEMGVAWSKANDAYREAVKSDPQGGHVRPHTRRGHFHRFRIGPRDEEIRYVTHWIPPTLVGDISKYKPSNQGHIIGSHPEKKKKG